MTDLTGHIALVTGSSRGIGQAIALALARNGVDIAVNFISRKEAAQGTVERIMALGRKAIAVQADVSVSSEVDRMVQDVRSELGEIEILVNNAAIAKQKTIEEVTEADWDETIAVNLKSAFLLTQAVIPGMRERGWGRIINISSGAAQTGGIMGPHYTASKAGIEGLTRAYAAGLVKEGITVNAIAPSIIRTDMMQGMNEMADRIPLGRMGHVDEIAEAVVFVSGNGYLTGQTICMNGGLYFR
ncbi:MAG: 3-oxoacyl-ACP reductase FabG [Deltaproteobacteria bacterium]|nr:3-oxoacyl-ACP reductase FabG [Deltaproteobacteria bacterium]